ncbi:glycosyl hydrolase [Flavobacterium nackdongense]|uniref:T9SS type A sorting domain-containing protein n=1 Tax=Flavobacterium nackdongense TaxID=2547394 RepID=A0A4P6YHP5_9FLAO|nr:glycosyl hydrolase [Flavobacterium nackdongense]QBN20385.1 T9SS type A sorting domain-containing protein [Flavobacterium nackdongense]
MKRIAKYSMFLFVLISANLAAQTNILVENTKVTVVNLGGNNYTVGSNAELLITAPVIGNGTVNLTADSGWLILDGVLPSRAINLHLSYIRVNGQPARNNINVKVTNYLRGCVIMAHSPTFEALTMYKDAGYTGEELKCFPYKYYKEADLGTFNNEVSSFKLKKGYMATFAQNQDGTGYSKVFIAEKADVEISTLQLGLDNQVSFVRVFPWRYTEKKGMGWSINSPIRTLRGSWFYNWGPTTTESTTDIEFVPCKWSANNDVDTQWQTILNNNSSNHLLGFNEPDGQEQANMSLELMLRRWPKMLESGMRLGSPAVASDLNLLYAFIDRCDALNYRVDFVAIHDYGEGTAQAFYNKCKAIYDRTKRPIWIKEFNFGGTWTAGRPTYEQSAARIKEIIERYDTEGIIERYAIFNFDEADQNRAVFYNPVENLVITPLGVVYRDQTSAMAFNPAEQINIPIKQVAPVNFMGFNTDAANTRLRWENFMDNTAGTFRIERSLNGGVFTQIAVIAGTNTTYIDNVSSSGLGRYTYRITSLNPVYGNSLTVSNMVDVLANGKQNVARFKDVKVSSTHSAPFPGTNAVDGGISLDASRWVSRANSIPATIEIDLNGTYVIDELVFYTGLNNVYSSPIINFQFQYWDGAKWVNAISETANTLTSYRKSFPEVSTNKVRLFVNESTGAMVRLFEIEVYGKEISSLSIKENEPYVNKFTIYPNPTSRAITVEGNDPVHSIVIFDINAKTLLKEENTKSVDVSELSAGTYFVRINDKETFRFIKK